jgi:hypothetical protein
LNNTAQEALQAVRKEQQEIAAAVDDNTPGISPAQSPPRKTGPIESHRKLDEQKEQYVAKVTACNLGRGNGAAQVSVGKGEEEELVEKN